MGKILAVSFALFLSFLSLSEGRTATWKLSKDINRDGKNELLIHDLYEGNASYGQLRIYNSKKLIFSTSVQNECYLWLPEKQITGLNPDFFPDLDKDGIVEIIIGHREESCDKDVHCEADKARWFDVYKWNGKTYILADSKFPVFYKGQLVFYKDYLKEKGTCGTVKYFIKRAQRLAGK